MARVKNMLFQCEVCYSFKDSGYDFTDGSAARILWCDDCNGPLSDEDQRRMPQAAQRDLNHVLDCIEAVREKLQFTPQFNPFSAKVPSFGPVCKCDMRDLLSTGHNAGCEAEKEK